MMKRHELTLEQWELIKPLFSPIASTGRPPSDRRVMLNGPRTVDIDLLLCGERVMTSPRLTIPHPGLRTRDFMLVPLLDLARDARDPRDGSRLLDALPVLTFRQIVRRTTATGGVSDD